MLILPSLVNILRTVEVIDFLSSSYDNYFMSISCEAVVPGWTVLPILSKVPEIDIDKAKFRNR